MNPVLQKYEENLYLFHAASKIPFCVFDNSQKDLLRYPVIESMNCSPKTMLKCCEILEKKNAASSCPILVCSDSCFLALLRLDQDTNVMFGPISSMPLTYKEFFNANKSNCDSDDLMHLYRVIQYSPNMELKQFAGNISLFVKLTLHETITTNEILANQTTFAPNRLQISSEYTHNDQLITLSETIAFQKKILSYIRTGNIDAIEDAFNATLLFSKMATTPLPNSELKKFYFIYITLCCISTMEEGLEIAKAFPLLETYLSKIPALTNVNDLALLCRQISLHYCRQVIKLHDTPSTSPVVNQCIRYIQNHINSKVTICDLAQYCNLSQRSITRYFSKYYHMPVSECILSYKLKEAEFLLTHSSFTLAEISHQLAFSSQSHFSVAFKKQYNETPQQYRDKFKK